MSKNYIQENSNKNTYDIIFLGLAQNCEKYLLNFFNKINLISKKKKIYAIIGENNSSDYTFNEILKLSKTIEKYFTFVDTTFIEKFDDRIKRLASARQALKNKINELNLKSKYICVVDLDDVIETNFTPKLIYDLIQKLEKNHTKHFGISVTSKPFYYDMLNFESKEFPNNNIKQIQNNRSLKSYKYRKKYIYDIQKKITLAKNFECISAFNGLCIYFYSDFINSNYLEKSDDVTPEHLYLNRIIHKRTKKKIYVTDKNLQMPEEHKPLSNIYSFLLEKFIKYLAIFFNKIRN